MTIQEVRKSLFDKVFPNHPEIAGALTLASVGKDSDTFAEIFKFAHTHEAELIAIYEKGQTLDDVEVQVTTMGGVPVHNTVQMTTDILKAKYGKK